MGFDKKLYSNCILIIGREGNKLFCRIKLLPLFCSEKCSLCGFKQRFVVGVPCSNLYSLTKKITNKTHYIDEFIIPSRFYMFWAMFSSIIRST